MIQIDMPMPETCKECFARDGVFCKASKYKRISYPELEKKAEWCPIHEVTADTDAISRKQAIDALEKSRFPGAPYIDRGILIALREIKKLPSAQPEKRTEKYTETHSCDLIDRQAAIEARCNTWS